MRLPVGCDYVLVCACAGLRVGEVVLLCVIGLVVDLVVCCVMCLLCAACLFVGVCVRW